MVVHVGVGCIPEAVRVEFHSWLGKRGLASALMYYETPDELADALLESFGDKVRRDNVVNERGGVQPGVAGCALVPPDQTAESFIAGVEAARAAAAKRNEQSDATQRARDELAIVQADLRREADRARENKALADAWAADQYRTAHPELADRPNPGGPMQREVERRQATAPA